MKKLTTTAFLLMALANVSNAAEMVNYCEDWIIGTDDGLISLAGGSTWKQSGYEFFMLVEDALIIQSSTSSYSELLSDGSRSIVAPVSGSCISSVGRKASVIRSDDRGRTLILDDGTILNFDSYSSFDTRYWYPPYEVLITSSELHMWNLDEGKRAQIKSVGDTKRNITGIDTVLNAYKNARNLGATEESNALKQNIIDLYSNLGLGVNTEGTVECHVSCEMEWNLSSGKSGKSRRYANRKFNNIRN